MAEEFKDTNNTQRILLIVCVVLSTSKSCGESSVNEIDWCDSKYSCHGLLNVMCKYPTKTQGLNCRNLKNTIDFDKRWKMLDMHNRIRAKFATGDMKGFPPAANMRILRWDYELEAIALRWAIQCLNRSDLCRKTPGYPEIGQNVAVRTYKKFTGEAKGPYSGKWFPATKQETARDGENVYGIEVDERKVKLGGPADPMQEWVHYQLPNADPKDIKPFNFANNTRKLFQVIWADTNRLGCSQVTFLNPQDWVTVSWVCNYAPAGIKEGSSSVYEPGKACSACPNGAECLCELGKPLLSSSQSIQDSLRKTTIFRVTLSFMHHFLYSIIIRILQEKCEH